MKFWIERTSGTEPPCQGAIKQAGGWLIEIPDLQALLTLREKLNIPPPKRDHPGLTKPHHLIIKGGNTIEIYDGWRE